MGAFGFTGKSRPAHGASHLHVQVERGGSVAGRHVFDKGSFRWGSATSNEMVYPVEGVKGSEVLFHAAKEGMELLVRPGMTGEITAGSSTLKVEDLGDFGLLKGSGPEQTLLVTEKMGGWVDYRGLRVFFTFGPAPAPAVEEKPAAASAPAREQVSEQGAPPRPAAPPAKPPKPSKPSLPKGEKAPGRRFKPLPPTPAHLKRDFMSKEDRHFTYVVAGLYVFMVIFNVYLASIYVKEPPKVEKLPERFAKLLYEAPQAKTRVKKELEEKKKAEEESQKLVDSKSSSAVAEKVAEAPREEPKAQVAEPSGGGGGGGGSEPTAEQMAQRREAIRKEVSKKGLLGVLGGRGGAATSKARGSILQGGGRSSVDLDKLLGSVGGLKAGANGGAGGSGDGTGGEWKGARVEGATLDSSNVGASSQRVANLEQRKDTAVKSAETAQVEDISMKEAVSIINRTVETYLGGIRYLYNRELRKNAELEGKVTIAISIDPEGAVTSVELVETTMNAPELIDGIIARIKRWTFPKVAQKTITVKYPFVFFPSM